MVIVKITSRDGSSSIGTLHRPERTRCWARTSSLQHCTEGTASAAVQSLGKSVLSTYGYDHAYWWRFAPIGFLIFFIIVMNGITAVALRILSGVLCCAVPKCGSIVHASRFAASRAGINCCIAFIGKRYCAASAAHSICMSAHHVINDAPSDVTDTLS